MECALFICPRLIWISVWLRRSGLLGTDAILNLNGLREEVIRVNIVKAVVPVNLDLKFANLHDLKINQAMRWNRSRIPHCVELCVLNISNILENKGSFK